MKILSWLIINIGIVGTFLFMYPSQVEAHCDTLDGPVVTAGQKALDTGNVHYALIWVKKDDEQQLIEEFKKAQKNRQAADKQAERLFFEALVKIHREGEGAAYTGLKEAGELELYKEKK